MADPTPALLAFLKEVDQQLSQPTTAYLSGGVAVVIAYGGTEDTKDFDVVRANRKLEKVAGNTGKGSPIHEKTGYYLDLVPAIFPIAPGFEKRTKEVLELQRLKLRVLEVHDLVISKLLRMHEKDRRDIETLCRHETFSTEAFVERYRAARESVRMYWGDKLEKADKNFNEVLENNLGEPPIDWREDYSI